MLTELLIQGLKPKEKRYMKADKDGLYIEVVPAGQKYWWYLAYINGKRKKISLGKWPEVSLKDARDLLVTKKRENKIASFSPTVKEVLMSEIVEEWFRIKKISNYSDGYKKRVRRWLNNYILPKFKNRPINSITSPEILEVCRAIENEGMNELAHRVLNLYSQIFRYAMPFYVQGDPAAALSGKLVPIKTKHFARVTDPRYVGILMADIEKYPRHRVRNALLMSAYTFCRPGEIRRAEWSEIDLDRSVWKIPPEKMKMRRPHIVPLASQVVLLLKDQKSRLEVSGLDGEYIFPSERGPARCMSENTVRLALRTLGYGADDMTAHGFRGMASTLLNESGLWSVDAIELQLAHVEGNAVRAAYNEATLLPERTKMMQWYADELDRLADIPKA